MTPSNDSLCALDQTLTIKLYSHGLDGLEKKDVGAFAATTNIKK